MNRIKNAVIDLGGVVITLDRDRCVRAFTAMGLPDTDSLLGLYRQEPPFLSLETGEITAGEFYDTIRALLGRNVTDVEIQNAFLEFLVEIPLHRLRALREAREKGLNLYVLSNTNPVMYDAWITRAFKAEGLTINDYFDGVVTSFGEGTCKPDPEIFRLVLTRYDLDPSETVMLDDSEANCKAAESVGMHSIRVTDTPDGDLCAILQRLITSPTK